MKQARDTSCAALDDTPLTQSLKAPFGLVEVQRVDSQALVDHRHRRFEGTNVTVHLWCRCDRNKRGRPFLNRGRGVNYTHRQTLELCNLEFRTLGLSLS